MKKLFLLFSFALIVIGCGGGSSNIENSANANSEKLYKGAINKGDNYEAKVDLEKKSLSYKVWGNIYPETKRDNVTLALNSGYKKVYRGKGLNKYLINDNFLASYFDIDGENIFAFAIKEPDTINESDISQKRYLFATFDENNILVEQNFITLYLATKTWNIKDINDNVLDGGRWKISEDKKTLILKDLHDNIIAYVWVKKGSQVVMVGDMVNKEFGVIAIEQTHIGWDNLDKIEYEILASESGYWAGAISLDADTSKLNLKYDEENISGDFISIVTHRGVVSDIILNKDADGIIGSASNPHVNCITAQNFGLIVCSGLIALKKE